MYTGALMAAARLVWPDCGDPGRRCPGLVNFIRVSIYVVGVSTLGCRFYDVPNFYQYNEIHATKFRLHTDLYDEASAKIRWGIGPPLN